eukprot:COSAG01_NODE_57453_length_312_cov_0.732394_1_plen_27_part_01
MEHSDEAGVFHVLGTDRLISQKAHDYH